MNPITTFLTWLLNDAFHPRVEEPVAPPAAPKSKYHGYDVEFYPENGVYYARHHGKYLKAGYGTGIIEANDGWSGFTYAQRFSDERDAWRMIDRRIEQQTKENVKIITRP